MSAQSRRIAIVTGANNGIGFETTVGMAEAGFHVVMACRSEEKAEAAKTEVLARVPSASLDIILVDLSDLASVRAFADAYRTRWQTNHHILCSVELLVLTQNTRECYSE